MDFDKEQEKSVNNLKSIKLFEQQKKESIFYEGLFKTFISAKIY